MKGHMEKHNSSFVKACSEATVDVLRIAVNVEARRADESPGGLPNGGQIFQAMVNIHGDWNGEVTVAFPRPLAAELVAKLGFCLVTDLDDEFIGDGVGEIINQIAGRVKTERSKQEWQLDFSLPEVSCLSQPAANESDEESTAICFECMEHTFILKTSEHTKACSPA